MEYTEDEIIDALMSDKLNEMVKGGTIEAVSSADGEVSLIYRSERNVFVTNGISVKDK